MAIFLERMPVKATGRRLGRRWSVLLLGACLMMEGPSRHTLATEARSSAKSAELELEWDAIEGQLKQHQACLRACGPLSSLYLLRRLGYLPPVALWQQRLSQVGKQGVAVDDVLRWCREVDASIRAWKVDARDTENALRQLPVPAILVVDNGQHCVVVEAIHRATQDGQSKVSVWDPARQKQYSIEWSSLCKSWSGAVIARRHPAWWLSPWLLAGSSCLQVTLLWHMRGKRISCSSE